jgi:hypothetical protein
MQKLSIFIIFCLLSACVSTQKTTGDWIVNTNSESTFEIEKNNIVTPFEANKNYTATYDEMVDFYKKLDLAFDEFEFKISGTTDVGRALYTGVISLDRDFDANSIRSKEKCIVFINNAIHPGEPTGVDATMMLVRDILTKDDYKSLLENTVFVFIPMYNVGGALNRGSFSRANQNGPTAYGFRGNVRNFDLNRDFIKCDTKNAQSFNQIYTTWRPHIFIDNHTSNGADYQYIMTLIPTQHNKLSPILSGYLSNKMLPRLYSDMAKTKYEMTPYVYARTTPDGGIAGFLDLPRYSSGYAALFNTLSFMPEAHMLKPYEDRVYGTHTFMKSMLELVSEDYKNIIENKKKADKTTQAQAKFDVNWEINRDTTNQQTVIFKGYEAKYKPSEVSGKERLYYDKNEPYTKSIPFFNDYNANATVRTPKTYVIPQGYAKVIERLKWNGVKMEQLTEDKIMEVNMSYIDDYDTRKSPYEGHYLHSKVKVNDKKLSIQYYKGDYLVELNQVENQYIIHTLEPQSADAFFAWNFFDAILQQKEYFSSYVFEDVAAQLLKDNPGLKKQLEEKKSSDEKFANSAYEQLLFVYRNSPYYEPTHLRYPIGRIF